MCNNGPDLFRWLIIALLCILIGSVAGVINAVS